jgi:urea transporter
MDTQPGLLLIIVFTCITSVLITASVMNKRHRKKINKLEKELMELNWYLLDVDNRKNN